LVNIKKLIAERSLWSEEGLPEGVLQSALEYVTEHVAWLENRQSLAWYEVPPNFPGMIGGVARAVPIETSASQEAKSRWLKILQLEERLQSQSPADFESLGKEILSWYGVLNPIVTRQSNDAGIDFVGEGRLGELTKTLSSSWTVIDNCRVLFFGQAKKYSSTVVGTADLRELVGSVSLLQRDSYRDRFGYGELPWSLLQPRVLLFITTSRFSEGAVRVAEEAGIILADRDQICKIYDRKLRTS